LTISMMDSTEKQECYNDQLEFKLTDSTADLFD